MLQVPIQLASAALMLVSADWAESRLKEADIVSITVLFFVLVLLAATQDIAVDGWALTLLSRQNIGCAASTLFPHPRLASTLGAVISQNLPYTFLSSADQQLQQEHMTTSSALVGEGSCWAFTL